MTAFGKGDPLVEARASLEVERAQNATLHRELARLRPVVVSVRKWLLGETGAASDLVRAINAYDEGNTR